VMSLETWAINVLVYHVQGGTIESRHILLLSHSCMYRFRVISYTNPNECLTNKLHSTEKIDPEKLSLSLMIYFWTFFKGDNSETSVDFVLCWTRKAVYIIIIC
jgi:hypothetical protein